MLLILASCAPPPGAVPAASPTTPGTGPAPPVGAEPAPPTSAQPHVDAAQARGIVTLLEFLDAFRAGDVSRSLSLMGEGIIVTDCEYGSGIAMRRDGKTEVGAWLRDRAADHDVLIAEELQFGTPNSIGEFAIAVTFERRTSDTLRRLGFTSGIVPRLATKAILSADGRMLDAFVNASTSSADACRAR